MNKIILKSRNYPNPESFVKDFLTTLTPGIIPRSNFIKWDAIERKIEQLTSFVEFYMAIKTQIKQGANFREEIANSLLACDDPYPYICCAFELLGHTNQELVTQQDDINFLDIAKRVQHGDENTAYLFGKLLQDLGFTKILEQENLENVLLGVQIGLESHRRKNIGGDYFKNEVKKMFNEIVRKVVVKTGIDIKISEEIKIIYGEGLSKKVDFTIKLNNQTRFGVEVNFYTVPGSKPTEIKRSYGDIRRGLLNTGVDLIWITDGKGYRRMKRSLRDAYIIFPNIYNLNQAKQFLADDLISLFKKPWP